METSFSEHFDRLIQKLKLELLQHYDRDIAGLPKHCTIKLNNKVPLTKASNNECQDSESDSEARQAYPRPACTPKVVLPKKLWASAASSSDESEDTSMSSGSAGARELMTPKNREVHPQRPHAPREDSKFSPPKVTPKMLLVSQVAPATMETLPLPNSMMDAQQGGDSCSESAADEDAKGSNAETSKSSSSSSSGSSASFASSSDEGGGKNGTLNGRMGKQRHSNSSIPSFFKTEDASSRVWQFLEDPESSTGAFYFARSWNYILTISSMVAVGQASISPIFSDALLIGICQTIIEVLLIIECIAHFCTSQGYKAYLKNPYNIIDILALLPLLVRLVFGPATPTKDENIIVHFILACYVPLLRMLKLVRRFQKLQLLLHVLATVIDALKLLLFMISIIVLVFSVVLYMVDDPKNIDSLATAIWMCTVTVTTVGYGDITPVSWPAKIVSGVLCFISVLFMAMPLSVVGNAMSQTWSDRHRILLVTRARQRLKSWGVSAGDMPRLFKKFDRDGNGELGMDEFVDLVARMKIGMKPSEASDLFMAFDTDGSGGIDEREFMKALFPLDYRRMYRRASGVTFGA
ncbi:unnamed protein product [Effrenium voratum]|nr:unnamed protein product [Effrenium voratum]